MNKKATTLVASAVLLGCEIGHASEGLEIPTARYARAYQALIYDNRSLFGLDHSHTEGPEEVINVTSSLSASGSQVFEVYAVVTEGTNFSAVVSAKGLAAEKFYTSEEEANKRAAELQREEGEDSNIQYAVRPVG
jgi:hypothetical protein